MLGIIAAIKATAEENALAPALITGSRIITYGETINLIARISNYFADRRLERLSKVFLNIADGDFRLIVTLACLHYGLVPFVLADAAEHGADADYDLVIAADVPRQRDPAPDLVIDQSVLGGKLSDGRLREFADRGDDDLLFVGVTTGTTGRPKLVAEPYGIFRRKRELRQAQSAAWPPSLQRAVKGDRFLSTIGDLSRAGFWNSLEILERGAAQVRPSRNLSETLKNINWFAVSAMYTTPDTATALMDQMDALRVRCPSVRRIRLTGSLFPRALLERIEANFDAAIAIGYGTSEVGEVSTGLIDSATFREGYVGEILSRVTVVSAGTSRDPQPIKLANRLDLISPGYRGGRFFSPNETIYDLPDLGYVEGNSLFLLGRDDEVFNLEGDKTAFSIIENDLRAERGVKDVGILGGALIGDFRSIVIGIVGSGLDHSELVERVCRTLKAPRAQSRIRMLAMERIPRNASGKVDRRAMIEAFRASEGATSAGAS